MMKVPSQAKEVAQVSVLIQYLAQRKIDINFVLTTHDTLVKNPASQNLPENQVAMTTLVYHYMIEDQLNNLFQLVQQSKNLEFLAIKLCAYLKINRVDLADKTLKTMKTIEEDNVLVTLCQCWLTMHDGKCPVQSYDTLIESLGEMSDKFGYSLKTYNLLGLLLLMKGETEKACKIFQSALDENNILGLEDSDPMF